MTPVRVQLSRAKGWRLPPNTISVARPTQWGNPFTTRAFWDAGYKGSVETANANCVGAYKAWLLGERHWAHGIPIAPPPDITPLRGKNLACWCKPGLPCHADVLLELANAEPAPSSPKGT